MPKTNTPLPELKYCAVRVHGNGYVIVFKNPYTGDSMVASRDYGPRQTAQFHLFPLIQDLEQARKRLEEWEEVCVQSFERKMLKNRIASDRVKVTKPLPIKKRRGIK